MTRRILVLARYSGAIAAALASSPGLAVVAPPVSPRRREFDYPATAKPYDPPNDVARLRREQRAREHQVRKLLPKRQGRGR